MAKALTKEDLIYILQSLLKISEMENNSLKRVDDGLFVNDASKDIEQHASNNNVHITSNIKNILDKITVNENDEIMYNNKKLSVILSQEKNNMISLNEDGLFVPNMDCSNELNTHIDNLDVHVTKKDKDSWNNILNEAKQFLDNEIKSGNYTTISIVEQLPNKEESISSTNIYLLKNDTYDGLEYTFGIYVYYNDSWYSLGITSATLNNYVTKELLNKKLELYVHNNISVLDKLSEDENGNLLYNNIKVVGNFTISDKELNAIRLINNKLYVRDYSREITSIIQSSSFVKSLLYDNEIDSCGTYILYDDINNYSLILIDYYYKRNNDDADNGGCGKTAIINTDILNDYYSLGRNYMIEYGYGNLIANIQLLIDKNKLFVNYQHDLCIYKITGIKKGDAL